MSNVLYLAARYMVFHKAKTAILIISLALILFLPAALQIFARVTERGLMARASATPLVLGARGSSLDLVIESLYFQRKAVHPVRWGDCQSLWDAGEEVIPLYTRFRARGFLVAGTTTAYFEQRGLRLAQGAPLRMLGECVLGAEAARALGVGPGGSLTTEPENLFDIAGVYPLKMRVAGVLERAHTPDDRAVFVDIKTAWVIQGLGHGHQDVSTTREEDVILKREGNAIAANAKLQTYTEITPENVDTFHFHGDRADFPITAALVFPQSRKNEDLLRGRFQDDERLQIVKPETVIEGLNAALFRVQRIMNSGIALVGIAAALLTALVFMLSARLRRQELETMYKLGCARGTAASLIFAELGIISGAALVIALGLAALASVQAEALIQRLIF